MLQFYPNDNTLITFLTQKEHQRSFDIRNMKCKYFAFEITFLPY